MSLNVLLFIVTLSSLLFQVPAAQPASLEGMGLPPSERSVETLVAHKAELNATYPARARVTVAGGRPLDIQQASTDEPQPDVDVSDFNVPLITNARNEEGYSTSALVFSIDISGSMDGRAFENTILALQNLTEDIDGRIPIAIITFGNQASEVLDYSVQPDEIIEALETIQLSEAALLYDGVTLAVEKAIDSGVPNTAVIVITDSIDQNRSEAGADVALALAEENDVQVNTIALGFEAAQTYLQELAEATGGTYERIVIDADISTSINEYLEPIGATVLADNEFIVTDATLAPLEEGDPAAQSNITLDEEGQIDPLDPLGGGIAVEPEAMLPDEEAEDGEETAPDAGFQPISNTMPIEIDVADEENVVQANLAINGVPLTSFNQSASYQYDLDMSLLVTGTYRLTFTITNDDDQVIGDSLEFDVVVQPPAEEEPAEDAAEDEETTGIVTATEEAPEPVSMSDASLQRVLLIGSRPVTSLSLEFDSENGLVLADSTLNEIEEQGARTLLDILTGPLDAIPEPIKNAFLQPRPGFVTGVIIAMTIILLPQGLFTVYWMTYTWVSYQRLERSRSPKEFYDPHYSFTALLPARKEEEVIYETIRSVDKVDYPEELKEILILVRDEDDDETIAESKRAIDDIRRSYEERGEEWPNNVHLITFTDGPKNKPNGLNRGYKASTKDVLCIFDSEDNPHPEIYNVINTVMLRDGADVVQAGVQLMNFKAPWFSAFNVLEYFFWFKSGLHAFTHALNVTPLGGNTVFFKKEWLDKLAAEDVEKGYRAWDEGLLTEDADVGIRLTNLGAKITIVYEARQATQEETPHNVEQFIKQRTRWCQGFYEIFMKGVWTRLPSTKQRIASIYILLNSLLQASTLIFLPIGVFIFLTQEVPVPIALMSWLPIYLLIVQLVISLVGIREFTESYGLKLPLFFRLRMAIFYYPYQLLLAAGAMRGIFRFLTNQSSWEKTAHTNLHRQQAAGGH